MIQIKNSVFTAIAPLLIFLLSACTTNACRQTVDSLKHTATNGFVVLELFTSEGCSSCPPAEKLLEEIQREAAGKPIYILAYHVDYWDRLGWKDAFSNHDFSNRQYEYSSHFAGQVYTPQLIINGMAEGVGSDASFVNNNIAKMLANNHSISLKTNAQQKAGNVFISYEINEAVKNTRIQINIIQKQAVSHVARGENEGRTLTHTQIVRSLSAFEIGGKTKGTEKLQLPVGFNTQDFEIIAFLQNTESGEIVAASRVAVNQ